MLDTIVKEQKLYLVHCGFYDPQTSFGGVYEGHTNLILVADSARSARLKAKSLDIYKEKRMHIDGIQEIIAVDGYKVALIKDTTLKHTKEIKAYSFQDLAELELT